MAKRLCVNECLAGIFSQRVVKEFEIDEAEADEKFLVGVRYDKYAYISKRLFHSIDELYQYASDNGFREPIREEVDAYCTLKLNCYVDGLVEISYDDPDVKIDKENKKVTYFPELQDMGNFSKEQIKYLNSEGIKYVIWVSNGERTEYELMEVAV